MSVLVISPHLDDAVLSCGPLISAWRRKGRAVTVLNVFTAGPVGELSTAAVEDRTRYDGADPMPIRWAEEKAAAAILGYESIQAALPELIFRRRPDGRFRCESLEDIFYAFEPEDELVVDDVMKAIPLHFELVLAPLGVGGHVDHEIVRRAAERLELGELAFYQDQPYVLRGEPVTAPQGAHAEVWKVDEIDLDAWISAIEAYPTQVKILFSSPEWKSALRQWAISKGSTYLLTQGPI